MDDIKVKRNKKSDKAKRNAEMYGKYSQKAVRQKEAVYQKAATIPKKSQP